MTKSEVIKEFFKKSVLPVAVAALLYCIFKSACTRWCHRLCMAVHTLRSAFWHPTDVRLDRTGRLFGNRPSAVPAELYYWWSDWRFRPGLAAVGCSMVYIPHYLPDKCRMHTMI